MQILARPRGVAFVASFALVLLAAQVKGKCMDYCENSCLELNGNVADECDDCTPDKYECYPGAEGFAGRSDPVPEGECDMDAGTPEGKQCKLPSARRSPKETTGGDQQKNVEISEEGTTDFFADEEPEEGFDSSTPEEAQRHWEGGRKYLYHEPDECPNEIPSSGTPGLYVICAKLPYLHPNHYTVNLDGEKDGGVDALRVPKSYWADEHSRLLMVHGTPLFLTKLPDYLGQKSGMWTRWLLSREERWRKENGGILQIGYDGGDNGYNLFKEAFDTGGAVEKYARKQVSFIRDRWLAMMQAVHEVVNDDKLLSANEGLMRMLRSSLSKNICGNRRSHQCKEARSTVLMQSWVNVLHRSGKYAGEVFEDEMHDHMWPWHGYIILDGNNTGTTFASPDFGNVFTMKHSQNYILMLPGGIYHVPRVCKRSTCPEHRVTQAFDIRFTQHISGHGMNLLYEGEIAEGQPIYQWFYQK
mmetsp:Transcript_37607/g.60359  ORF Transcript_37607/g.60359 Transcript_37607/m.60359 type:complete len:472 (+) Transcript_37607:69-1484(+)